MTENLLEKAYKHCIAHGYRFTNPREQVLKILANETKPLGAYDILQRLSNEINKPNPPTVYRAIQFWHQEGFIHCIDSLKSYVACSNGHHLGQTQFLICNQCDFVKELENIIDFTPVTKSAKSIQFSIMNCTVEIKGLCANCNSS
ncbi:MULTISPECIES: Fur family transcriptional regulator [Legionella]|uniref:Transcriptional repressor n=1 Tax=Legionella septentrionalis TaxID=2498109 RepID=A0A433JGC0_9GAMM|nr:MULTISPECIES: Fur family transcriptional regulator [Legionella]MCP0913386.1 transcriptional repressor [Legionella sp. 27cVA30]RUQ79176.1 transcriptional repressor [Legionella septentrionalis]RUQ93524.1 transcriptional repressor [Legionella septentrionalis]RUR08996.1 transcriptional repressor [Legionella septentrionalis]RUR14893.1 transcriptional repressor [Legionella septentrionalis]